MEALLSHPKVKGQVDESTLRGELFPLASYVALLQKFSVNNVGVRVVHPVCAALLGDDDAARALSEYLAASIGEELNSEDEDALTPDDILSYPEYYYPPIDGEGIFHPRRCEPYCLHPMPTLPLISPMPLSALLPPETSNPGRRYATITQSMLNQRKRKTRYCERSTALEFGKL